eukprot:6336695-Ditylum_brightwellii.AAC.1
MIITPTKDDRKDKDREDNDSVVTKWTNTTGIGIEGIEEDLNELEELAVRKNINDVLKDGKKQEKWMICLYKSNHRCVAPKAIPIPCETPECPNKLHSLCQTDLEHQDEREGSPKTLCFECWMRYQEKNSQTKPNFQEDGMN